MQGLDGGVSSPWDLHESVERIEHEIENGDFDGLVADTVGGDTATAQPSHLIPKQHLNEVFASLDQRGSLHDLAGKLQASGTADHLDYVAASRTMSMPYQDKGQKWLDAAAARGLDGHYLAALGDGTLRPGVMSDAANAVAHNGTAKTKGQFLDQLVNRPVGHPGEHSPKWREERLASVNIVLQSLTPADRGQWIAQQSKQGAHGEGAAQLGTLVAMIKHDGVPDQQAMTSEIISAVVSRAEPANRQNFFSGLCGESSHSIRSEDLDQFEPVTRLAVIGGLARADQGEWGKDVDANALGAGLRSLAQEQNGKYLASVAFAVKHHGSEQLQQGFKTEP